MTDLPLTRVDALSLIHEHNEDQKDIIHYLESEAIMGTLARRLEEEDVSYWKMLGLLHDVDWGITKNSEDDHLSLMPGILEKAGFDEEFITIVLSHGYGYDIAGLLNKKRTRKIEHALSCAETITGLIHAYTLVRGRKISGMKVKGLKKRFKDKAFAAKVSREIIKECENLGLTLDEFFGLSIEAIEGIKEEVGLT